MQEHLRSILFLIWRLATSSSAVVGLIFLGSAIWAVLLINALPKIPPSPLGQRQDRVFTLKDRLFRLKILLGSLILTNFVCFGCYARVFLAMPKDAVKFPGDPPYLASTWAASLISLLVTIVLGLVYRRKMTLLKADIEQK